MEDQSARLAVDEEVFGSSVNTSDWMADDLQHGIIDGPAHPSFADFKVGDGMSHQMGGYTAPRGFDFG